MNSTIFSLLVPNAEAAARENIASVLSRFGEPALKFAAFHGVRLSVLAKGETYCDASQELSRLRIDVDAWPAPPAGLFVVAERTVYLRSLSCMTVAHEFGHALDCALGEGVYYSGIDPQIRAAFASARSFITPYAATGLDEFFAESCRAYVGDCDDPGSAWPAATRARLQQIDPAMYSIVVQLFEALRLGKGAFTTAS